MLGGEAAVRLGGLERAGSDGLDGPAQAATHLSQARTARLRRVADALVADLAACLLQEVQIAIHGGSRFLCGRRVVRVSVFIYRYAAIVALARRPHIGSRAEPGAGVGPAAAYIAGRNPTPPDDGVLSVEC